MQETQEIPVRLATDLKLPATAWRVLIVGLATGGEMVVSELADAIDSDPMSTRKACAALERAGLATLGHRRTGTGRLSAAWSFSLDGQE